MKGRLVFAVAVLLSGSAGSAYAIQQPLAPSAIPQFVQPLPRLSVAGGTVATTLGNTSLDITMCEFDAKVLPPGTPLAPGAPSTTRVYGYVLGNVCPDTPQDTYLGPVIVNARNQGSTNIRFVNNLGTTETTAVPVWKYASDQTLHWADPLGNGANMCSHMVMFPPFGSDCARNYVGPIPAVPHLHGGEVPPELDGGPDAWYTSDGAYKGPGYYTSAVPADAGAPANSTIYRYPNTQEASPIWFHDHVLGGTRLNVYAGLAGAYLITDPALQLPAGLHPAGLMNGASNTVEYTVPLVIQDRMFDTNGQLFSQSDSAGGILWAPNPDHPYWAPELVGDTIVVNGKAWPFLNVEPKRYRFWFINGSNARAYELFLTDPISKNMGPPVYLIATDGGYLDAPVKIDPLAAKPALTVLTIMPGERYEAIVDFNGYQAGTIGPNGVAYSGKWLLKNTAKSPYPAGTAPLGATTGRIMQFNVGTCQSLCGASDTSYNPASGAAIRPEGNKVVRLVNAATGTLANGVTVAKTRQLTLNEVMGMPQTVKDPVTGLMTAYPGGPLEILVNNTKWSGERAAGVSGNMYVMAPIPGFTPNVSSTMYISELPQEGTTEVWEIVNLTADAHPMHLHLVQFQLMNRQAFNVSTYNAAYAAAFPGGGYNPMTATVYPAGVFIPGFGPPLPYAPSDATGGKYGGNPDVAALVKGKPAYLQGQPKPPSPNEAGWKDTVIVYPGQVTRLAVRYAPTDKAIGATAADLAYPFDTYSGGNFSYVWHCHIIDHEDNEMMRPQAVPPNPFAPVVRALQKGVHY